MHRRWLPRGSPEQGGRGSGSTERCRRHHGLAHRRRKQCQRSRQPPEIRLGSRRREHSKPGLAKYRSRDVNIDGVVSDIQVNVAQGQILLHLPEEQKYDIYAKSEFGSVNSDFLRTGEAQPAAGTPERLAYRDSPSRRLQLRNRPACEHPWANVWKRFQPAAFLSRK